LEHDDLVNAIQEFRARRPEARIVHLQIGYFGDDRMIWCDLTYNLPGTDASQTQGFGFDRLSGSEWRLNWPEKKISPLTPVPPYQRLGNFTVSSPNMVVTDPGYEEDTAHIGSLGCFVKPCALGVWTASIAKDSTLEKRWEMPRSLLLYHTSVSLASIRSDQWQRLAGAGGDSGLIVACDLAHFHDERVIPPAQIWTFNGEPADPEDLWYSFVCETIESKMAVTIPYGVVVSWDGGMDVDAFRGRIAEIIGSADADSLANSTTSHEHRVRVDMMVASDLAGYSNFAHRGPAELAHDHHQHLLQPRDRALSR